MSTTDSDFSNVICINEPTTISEFEKEISKQIASMSKMTENLHDIEELIVDALKRRCNDRKTIMHAHLRLKNGATTCTMTWNELAELSEMIAFKGAANAIIKRLANFYVRIAALQNQIQHARQSVEKTHHHEPFIHENSNHALLSAYEKNEETIREKHQQNQRELDQIMRSLFLNSEIHPQLTENDLPALETQVQHIAQRGCVVQELRRLKIIEALLEETQCNKLLQELATLTR
jgi:hypothetical protein